MSNVLITVELPTERESGQPLSLTDIDRVDIELSTGSAFALVDSIIAPGTTLQVNDLPNGAVVFRAIVYDLNGKASSNFDVAFDNSGPKAVTSMTVTVI